MASSTQPREWTGLQQFPVPTQNSLHALLGKLRQENVNTLTVLVLGKGGVGKSSTVNSLIGERVAVVSAFQSETMRTLMCSRVRAGFTLNIIDTPGLVEGLFVNDHALDTIRRSLLNKTIDVMIYVDRLDGYRVDNLDRQVIRAISRSFGPQIWKIGLLALTHAQLSPPDGISYSDFVARRSAALQEAIHKEAGFKKTDTQVPVALVENSGRCSTNDGGEKILPGGLVWLPKLVEQVVEIAVSSIQPVVIDQKLIEGPNANQRGKIFIPIVLMLQFLLVIKPIQGYIQQDVKKEKLKRPMWEIRSEEYRLASTLSNKGVVPPKGATTSKGRWRGKS